MIHRMEKTKKINRWRKRRIKIVNLCEKYQYWRVIGDGDSTRISERSKFKGHISPTYLDLRSALSLWLNSLATDAAWLWLSVHDHTYNPIEISLHTCLFVKREIRCNHLWDYRDFFYLQHHYCYVLIHCQKSSQTLVKIQKQVI